MTTPEEWIAFGIVTAFAVACAIVGPILADWLR